MDPAAVTRAGRPRTADGAPESLGGPGPGNPSAQQVAACDAPGVTDHPALIPYGWDGRVAALVAEVLHPGCVPARVVRVELDRCIVVADDGEHPARARALPAVGDWVAARVTADDTAVAAVAPRWSELARRDPDGRTQVLAADVDLVLVTAPVDRLSPARVERETAIAWDSGARPVVLVTKCDLAPGGLVDDLRRRLVGVDVVATSVVTGDGVDEVRAALRPARTAVLLGPSGGGKSSLANRLLGGERLATGAVRPGDRRGRHTTTARQLLVVPSGGVLIDTPGLRSLSLPADHGGVAAAFPDVEALAAGAGSTTAGTRRSRGALSWPRSPETGSTASAWQATGSWRGSSNSRPGATTRWRRGRASGRGG